jgi:uncharacterized protein
LEAGLRKIEARSKQHPLRLNVGFLLHQGIGTSREFDFDLPAVALSEDVDLAFLRGALKLSRISQGLYLQGRLETQVSLECDRCLTGLEHPLQIEPEELLHYPPQPGGDPLLAVPETGILDLKPLLREYFLVGIPMHPLCRPDCKGLCPECGGNRNEIACEHPATEVDARLAGLKSLLPDS